MFRRSYVLGLLVLVAGCSAGAASGTSAPNGRIDAGTDSASRKGTGGTTGDSGEVTDPRDEEDEDAGASDALAPEAGAKDSSASDTSAPSDASLDAIKPDSASDAGGDAAKDAMAEGGAATDASAICTIDDGAWLPTTTGRYEIVAKGKLWRIDASGALLGSTPLSSIAGMAQGPCNGQVGVCAIDAMTWRADKSEYHVVQGGKLWRLDSDGDLVGSIALTDYPGIAAGPCVGKIGAACTFEAGAWRADKHEYHLVADGKIWAIDDTVGTLSGSAELTSYAGVAQGPCAGVVGTCHVDAFTHRPDTDEIHVIAKGSLYVLTTAGVLESTTSLFSISGMANGPCK